jgi:hypothetical protein
MHDYCKSECQLVQSKVGCHILEYLRMRAKDVDIEDFLRICEMMLRIGVNAADWWCLYS